MAQVYQFVDANGETRLFAEITPDPAGTPFNGGTITDALTIAPATDVTCLVITAPAGGLLDLFEIDTDAGGFLLVSASGQLTIHPEASNVGLVVAGESGGTTELVTYQSNVGVTLARILASGALTTLAHAAPVDAAVQTGECVIWFDQTNGAAKLMLKAKTANGTVATAAIALA